MPRQGQDMEPYRSPPFSKADFALVLLSSLAGAGLIVDALHPAPNVQRILILVLFVVGLAVQLGFTARRRRRE